MPEPLGAPELIDLDPDDLAGFYQRASRVSGRDRSLSLEALHLGPDVLLELPAIASLRGRPASVAVVVDDQPMRRAGADLKSLVVDLLTGAGLEVAHDRAVRSA